MATGRCRDEGRPELSTNASGGSNKGHSLEGFELQARPGPIIPGALAQTYMHRNHPCHHPSPRCCAPRGSVKMSESGSTFMSVEAARPASRRLPRRPSRNTPWPSLRRAARAAEPNQRWRACVRGKKVSPDVDLEDQVSFRGNDGAEPGAPRRCEQKGFRRVVFACSENRSCPRIGAIAPRLLGKCP